MADTDLAPLDAERCDICGQPGMMRVRLYPGRKRGRLVVVCAAHLKAWQKGRDRLKRSPA
jgi:hypothetical protein